MKLFSVGRQGVELLFIIVLMIFVIFAVVIAEWMNHLFSPAKKVDWSDHLYRTSGGLLCETVIEYYDTEGILIGHEYISGEDEPYYTSMKETRRMPLIAWWRTKRLLHAHT